MKLAAAMACLFLISMLPYNVLAEVDRGDATSFIGVLLPWSRPEMVEYKGRVVPVPEGVAVATDGATYFYASTHPPSSLEMNPHCLSVASPEELLMVYIDDRLCRWAAAGIVACSDTTICFDILGTVAPPPFANLAASGEQMGATALTPYDYVQVGVHNTPSVSATGIRTLITMPSTREGFSADSCHLRWAGMGKNVDAGAFMQTGTRTCSFLSGWAYEAFCYGWNDGFANTWWAFAGPYTDTNAHYYQATSDPTGSSTYKCRRDATTLVTHVSNVATFSSPALRAVAEIAGPSTGLDPAHINFRPVLFGMHYKTTSGTWLDSPSMYWMRSAWNRDPPYEQTSNCLPFNIGSYLTSDKRINPATGHPCRDGLAW